jgi:hypothetical protein
MTFLRLRSAKSREHMSRATAPGLTARRVSPRVAHSFPPALAARKKAPGKKQKQPAPRALPRTTSDAREADRKARRFKPHPSRDASVKAESGQHQSSASSSNYLVLVSSLASLTVEGSGISRRAGAGAGRVPSIGTVRRTRTLGRSDSRTSPSITCDAGGRAGG